MWILSGPLDLSTDLVGQAAFIDFNWCAATFSCGNPLAPGGVDTFTIQTAGEAGDALVLTSMAAVPEPATLTLVAGGLLAGAIRRRRRLAA